MAVESRTNQKVISYLSGFLRASIVWLSFSCNQLLPHPIRSLADEPYITDYPLNRYESEIVAFEKSDSIAFPSGGKILFVGSSTFTKWKTMEKDFSPIAILNRGFGGSTIPEIIYYANRIIFPYKPKAIVVYGGENDLFTAKIKTADQVEDSYKTLITLIRQRLPTAPIYFISIKPTPSRWNKWPSMQKANQLIQQYTSTDKRLFYIDVSQAMLGSNGRPRPDLFTSDSLHMNSKGYQLWSNLIKSELVKTVN